MYFDFIILTKQLRCNVICSYIVIIDASRRQYKTQDVRFVMFIFFIPHSHVYI